MPDRSTAVELLKNDRVHLRNQPTTRGYLAGSANAASYLRFVADGATQACASRPGIITTVIKPDPYSSVKQFASRIPENPAKMKLSPAPPGRQPGSRTFYQCSEYAQTTQIPQLNRLPNVSLAFWTARILTELHFLRKHFFKRECPKSTSSLCGHWQRHLHARLGCPSTRRPILPRMPAEIDKG